MEEHFGLIDSKLKQPIPLDKITVDVKIKGTIASILSDLQYCNNELLPVEVVFVFPLEDRVSVCGFQVEIGDRIIKGKVEEKDEARDTYDDAVSSGKSAFLLEESEESSDIFTITVGNLPAKATAIVQIQCVVTLKSSKDGSLIFTLPRVLNPRYCPESTVDEPEFDNRSNEFQNTSVPFVKLPYDFCFDMQVEVGSEIEKIFSETDKLNVIINDDDKRKALVKLGDSLQFNHDIEVIIKQKSPFSAHVFIENGKQVVAQIKNEASWEENFENLPVVMLNYLPNFQLEYKTDSQFPSEFIFVIDRSGSMEGSNIKSAKDALLLFLKSLPVNCYFDIISFGTSSESFFDGKSEKYTDANLKKANKFVNTLEADMGGTEILEPLKHVYTREKPATQEKMEQNVFLLTDGGVSNTVEVINLVKENAVKSRCFALGIGHGASTALVNGVATAGRGIADFARGDERLQKKVISMLKRACKPKAGNIRVNWNLSNDFQVKQIPDSIEFLHDEEFLVVYGIITGPEPKEMTGNVILKYNVEGTEHEEDLSFNIRNDTEDGMQLSVHAVAAKDYMTQCNQSRDIDHLLKDNIIKLSKASGVMSKYTSYIAVDDATQAPVEGPMIYHAPYCHYASYCLMSSPVNFTMDRRAMVGAVGGSCFPRLSCLSIPKFKLPRLGASGRSQPSSYFVLVSFQSTSGEWTLTKEFSSELGKKRKMLTSNVPAYLSDTSSKADDINTVWATVLAIVWLTSKKFDPVQDELCMIIEKAEKWLLSNIPTGITRDQIVQDAKKAIGLSK